MKFHFYAIKVKEVATGAGHNDRSPCQVIIIDSFGEICLNRTIRPSKPVLDPFTETTGFTVESLEREGLPLDFVRDEIIELLAETTNSVLVGMLVDSSIESLQLEKGVHYHSSVDIGEHFKKWNKRFNSYHYFSLRNIIYGLTGTIIESSIHSYLVSLHFTMYLFVMYVQNPIQLATFRNQLFRMALNKEFPPPDFRPSGNICCFKTSADDCFCGQATVDRKYDSFEPYKPLVLDGHPISEIKVPISIEAFPDWYIEHLSQNKHYPKEQESCALPETPSTVEEKVSVSATEPPSGDLGLIFVVANILEFLILLVSNIAKMIKSCRFVNKDKNL